MSHLEEQQLLKSFSRLDRKKIKGSKTFPKVICSNPNQKHPLSCVPARYVFCGNSESGGPCSHMKVLNMILSMEVEEKKGHGR